MKRPLGIRRARAPRPLRLENLDARIVLDASALYVAETFGPTSYLSADDTPEGFFAELCDQCERGLEDFEDGNLDPRLVINPGQIVAPDFGSGTPNLTDSVDADDGVIDGTGQTGEGGRSWRSSSQSVSITFTDLVNSAGVVWTDGDLQSTNVVFEAYDQGGALIVRIEAGDLADDSNQGTTAEDRFFGVSFGDGNTTGIREIRLINEGGGTGIEIDHIQFEDCGACPTMNQTIDLDVAKSVDNVFPEVGQVVTWLVRLCNIGPNATMDATGVVVQDRLPEGVTYVSHSAENGTYDPATGIWTLADPLPLGGHVRLEIQTLVNAGTEGLLLVNDAEVIAADQPDVDSTPNNNRPQEDDQDDAVIRPVGLSSISGFSYADVNNDGVFQESETPLLGVEVTLMGTDLRGVEITRTTFTNSSGFYIFEDLFPGEYMVLQTQPLQFLDGKDTLGSIGGDDSINDKFTVELPWRTDAVNYNFGERGLISPNKRLYLTSSIYRYFQTVDVRQGDMWYVVEPGNRDWLEAELRADLSQGDVAVELYDAKMNPVPPSAANRDPSWEVLSGAQYFLRITGQNPRAEVRLADAEMGVQFLDGVLTIHGTPERDAIRLTLDDQSAHLVYNGETSVYDLQTLEAIDIKTGSGRDELRLQTGDGDDQVTVSAGTISLANAHVTLTGTGLDRQFIQLGSGTDQLTLHDSAKNDRVVVNPGSARASGPGYLLMVKGFEQIQLHADAGGRDHLLMLGSPHSDQIEAAAGVVRLTTPTTTAEARGFEVMRVQAAGGQDVAQLFETGETSWQVEPTGALSWQQSGHRITLHNAEEFEISEIAAALASLDEPTLGDTAVDEVFGG